MRSNHPLFIKYPLDQLVELDGESLSSPYHIYDGEMILIGGVADAAAAAELLGGERLAPVLDSAGNALMAVWVCNFTEANLRPHHELQISLFAAAKPQPPIARHPFAIHRLLLLNPDVCMVCHGLWNNTATVVRYNQVHLRLDARLSASRIGHDKQTGRLTFQVEDVGSEHLIAEGVLDIPKQQSPGVMWTLARHLGMRGMVQSARAPFVHVPVVNTRSPYAADNYVAHTYTRSDRQIIRLWDGAGQISIQHERYAPLNFRPDFVQYSAGIRFVYLRPQPLAHAGDKG